MRNKRKIFGIMVVFFAVFLALIFSMAESKIYAQTMDIEKEDIEAAPTESQIGEEEVEKVEQEEKTEEKIVGEEIAPDSITIDFKDAEIRTALRVLSEKSGVNIVAGKEVEGYITMRLSNVPWEKALEIICKNYGYAFEREGNIIRVTTIENLKQEELTTEVFTLNYANAKEVAEAIKEMLTDRGKDKIKYDERTNVLIVTDIPTNLYKVRQVVERLDKKTPQVLIEARIIETTLDDDENLGIDWSLRLAVAGASRPTTIPFETIGPRVWGKFELGNFLPVGKGAGSTTTTSGGSVVANASSDFHTIATDTLSSMPLATSDMFTMGTLDFTGFSMVMEYLKSRRDTNIISNPRVATLNNKEASIHIGTIIAIPTFERNPDTGTIEITGYTERDLGIKLKVTPHINDRGEIVVELKPEISDLLGYDVLDSARGIRAPRYSTREAETQVMVRSGETIMLGGLLKENNVKYKKKVPFLGDVPMFGSMLFTKTEEGIEKTELIIFMTVNLITSGPSDKQLASSSAYVPLPILKEKTN